MMRGNYFWLDNDLLTACKWDECQSSEGTVVYEVLRIINGVPLFFNEHYERLINSCRLIGERYEPVKEKLFQQFIELAKMNGFSEGNVTLKLIFNSTISRSLSHPVSQTISLSLLLYFIPHFYPTPEQYRDGVTVGFLEAERNNPEAKVEQNLREKANQLLGDRILYEVLLVDRDGVITEGSKSNMVFVKAGKLYTCQLNKVLTGITLTKVIEIAAKENIAVLFEAVLFSEISAYDALFITGTSPKILPVAKADEASFNVNNSTLRHIMEEYDQLVEEEIRRNVQSH